ncbi:hypothetical protein BJY52DRAFT_1420528 [Lactarius psammicola]|nr:hypothetical protein BJY52DRAFT_1420528 [Lactarius psammicola]
MLTNQQGENPTIQNCFCARCSAVRRTQAGPPTWYPVEQPDPRHFSNTIPPYLVQDQNVHNRAETAAIVPNRAWAQFVPPQTASIQDNSGYAPVQRVGPPNTGLPPDPTLDMLIAESRRRLAGRYLNNPDAYVSMIRLEPSPSGQLQVVITLEMTNVI